ncbi:Ankyrin repeat and mynd domain containing 2 [Mycena venus]|uniref:Ankyrin repeat and mynd domain containing 2 n=1 Tax=Mycena venus TaxID=2733690 RepID=A0A8H6YTB3_9AGAR|nr:Ankyrin repeat and mynd domain containing 2 [Mycena venus]
MNFMQTQPPAVRFLNTDILPLSSPRRPPEDGVATLLHRLGQPQVLERLLDTETTATFALRMKALSSSSGAEEDLYVRREGMDFEMGLVAPESSDETKPKLGVRYTVGERAPSSVYKTGPWIPHSSFDPAVGIAWGGTPAKARAQGAALARKIWEMFYLQNNNTDATLGRAIVCVEWAGMTSDDREKYEKWIAEIKQRDEKDIKEKKIEYEKLKAQIGVDGILADSFEDFKKTLLRCRAECGVAVATMQCGKCHFAKYCSAACQLDDWKYHKQYCGKEDTWDFSNEKFEDLLK